MSSAHRAGKLKFKKSKDEKKREYRNAKEEEEEDERRRRRKKRKTRVEDIENVSAGPSRHPTAFFGDDLLKAERYEAKLKEEQHWSSKLGDLLQDDLQGDYSDAAWEEEMMRIKGTEFRGEIQQEVPKRWKDAARGFESNIGRGAAGLKDMDEEEYAEYIREGMYRRSHATDIAFEEERQRKWQEAQVKKQKVKDEKRQARQKKREVEERKQSKMALLSTRKKWEEMWLHVLEDKDGHSLNLPYPIHPGPEISKDSIQYFLFHDFEKAEASKLFRKALLRYHPDRFFSSRHFINIPNEEGKERTRASVEKVAKILSDLVNDRRA